MKKISKLFAFLICLSAACGVFAAQSFSEVKNGSVSETVAAALSAAKASAASVPSSQYTVSSSLIKDITDADFNKEVLNYKGVVLVDFWQIGCNPCKNMLALIEKVAKDYKGKVKFVKMREDVSQETIDRYEIPSSYPFVVFFKNGKVEGHIRDFKPSYESNIRNALQSLL